MKNVIPLLFLVFGLTQISIAHNAFLEGKMLSNRNNQPRPMAVVILNRTALAHSDLKNEQVFAGNHSNIPDYCSEGLKGFDLSFRIQLLKWLYFDSYVNIMPGIFADDFFEEHTPSDFHAAFMPFITSTGALNICHQNGFKSSLRYRLMANYPANQSNAFGKHEYGLLDLILGYGQKNLEVNITIENILNSKWNETPFDIEPELKNVEASVDELRLTSGTPLAIKIGFSYFF